MRILRILGVAVLAFAIGIIARVTIRAVSPGLYAKIWGVPSRSAAAAPVPVHQPIATVPDIAKKQQRDQHSVLEVKKPIVQDPIRLDVTGILRRGERVIVVMSDGSVRTDEDNIPGRPARLTYLTRTFVEWDGERYWIKPRETIDLSNTESARSNAQPEGPRAQTGGPGAGPSFR